MNFTHFVSTDRPLRAENMPELLHGLMFSQAALQLCKFQETWDLVVPIYLGDPAKEFDNKKLSALFVQVKNRKTPKPWIVPENEYSSYLAGLPILAILFELGAREDDCSRVEPFNGRVFAFQILGHGSSTFACINHALEYPIERLLNIRDDNTTKLQNEVSAFNLRFREHTWAARFPGFPKTQHSKQGESGPSEPPKKRRNTERGGSSLGG